MLGLCVLRMLEYQVRPLGLTLRTALDEISSSKAAIVKLGDSKLVIPPDYGPVMKQIVSSLNFNEAII